MRPIPYLIASHAFLLLLLLLLLLLRRRLQRKQLQLNFRHRHHCSLIKRSMTTWWHKPTQHGSRRLHRHRQTGSTHPIPRRRMAHGRHWHGQTSQTLTRRKRPVKCGMLCCTSLASCTNQQLNPMDTAPSRPTTRAVALSACMPVCQRGVANREVCLCGPAESIVVYRMCSRSHHRDIQ